MATRAISWVLVGVFIFFWWWLGHGWDYLNAAASEWSRMFWIFSLISLVVLLRGARPAAAGAFGRFAGTLSGFALKLPWLVLAAVVMQAAMMMRGASADPAGDFIHVVVTALAAGIATALWAGAIFNAEDS